MYISVMRNKNKGTYGTVGCHCRSDVSNAVRVSSRLTQLQNCQHYSGVEEN
jgi:hypothetical protein